jgi:hypothetical protein
VGLVARLGMLPSAPVVMIEIELVILSENEDLYPCCRYHHQSFHALEGMTEFDLGCGLPLNFSGPASN